MKIKPQFVLIVLFWFFYSRGSSAFAGSIFYDFESGRPSGLQMFGDSMVADSGGSGSGGVLKLTLAKSNQSGGVILDSLDGTNAIVGFTATFKVLMSGGKGGDGFSFCFAPDLTNAVVTELGGGTGLIVTFDTYKNSVDRIAPAIRVYWKNRLIGETGVQLRGNRFADVFVQIKPEGVFNLGYDGQVVFTNLAIGPVNMTGQFALGSRTGGWFDNHWIDDLGITTDTQAPAFIESFSPADDNAPPDALVEVALKDWSSVDTASLRMKLDGKEVIPMQATNSANLRVICYRPEHLLEPGTPHTVYLACEGRGNTVTNTFAFQFSVNPNIYLSK